MELNAGLGVLYRGSTAAADWIRAEHLGQDASQCSGSFRRSAPRYRVFEQFLRDSRVRPAARFLNLNAQYVETYGLYSSKSEVSREIWRHAPEDDRFYHYELLASLAAPQDQLQEYLGLLAIRAFLMSTEFRQFLEGQTGLSLREGPELSVHRMTAHHFLRVHTDDDHTRLLAFVLYLSEGWDKSSGGALRFRQGDEVLVELPPYFNSLAIFDVRDQQHEVAQIVCSDARIGLGGWFARREATDTETLPE